MQLFKVLEKNKYKLYIFIAIVVMAVFFYFSFFSYYKYVINVLYPTQKVVYETLQTTKSIWHLITDLKGILEENEVLRKKNQELLFLKDKVLNLEYENQKLKELLKFSQKYKKFKPVGAEVIGYPSDFFSKAVVINVGSKNNIKEGSLVLYNGVLAGKIIKVGAYSSLVLLANDHKFKITAITRKTRETVFYNGSGKLDFVKKHQDIRVGDIIETSGFNNTPKGIPIGKIISIESSDSEFFKKVKVQPFVKQFEIEYVLVLINQ